MNVITAEEARALFAAKKGEPKREARAAKLLAQPPKVAPTKEAAPGSSVLALRASKTSPRRE
jgi:hypothetical protein